MNAVALAPVPGARNLTSPSACPEAVPASHPPLQPGRDTLRRVPNIRSLHSWDTAERIPTSTTAGDRAFTRLDCLVTLATLALLATLATPLLGNTFARSQRAVCANNLRQIATGFRAYAMNNQGKYPWIVATNNSLSQSYRAASAELGTTRILVCPADNTRTNAESFFQMTGSRHISYFHSRYVEEYQAGNWLAGDRHLSLVSMVTAASVSTSYWNKAELHMGEGNIALTDGQVQQLSTPGLRISAYTVLAKRYPLYIFKQ